MKWMLEYKGVRMSQEFDSPTEAAAHAKATWPDTPEATLADNDADDTPGWLVVAVQPPC